MRNRQRLIERGIEVLKGPAGLDATVEEIAGHAQVGPTTFYRHFPNREAFLAAVLDRLAAAGQAMSDRASSHDDPWEDFRVRFSEGCILERDDLALFNQIGGLTPTLAEQARRHVAEVIGDAVTREQHEGRLRPDVSVDEVAALMRMASDAPGDRDRYVDLLLNGLRTR